MRTYFIFKIKKHYANLTKNKPYYIYKTIEDMYYLNQKELLGPNNLFLQIHEKFNTEILNSIIYDKYKEYVIGIGKNIAVRLPNETLTGIFKDLSESGALMLELPDKSIKYVTAGVVFLSDERK
jgi:biotin-(acetyl-CoA carboxylase) ligase